MEIDYLILFTPAVEQLKCVRCWCGCIWKSSWVL